MSKDAKDVKISKAKGRPMLTWVGKKPLSHVKAYPAQHVESFSVEAPKDALADIDWSDWPEKFPQGGLLFHGDNKDVLAYLLANGFRGKVKLIYIDPPFDSGADYVRKVELRGTSKEAMDAEGHTLGEQTQYADMWANDNYLQFMYERLQLCNELLAKDGAIYVHCDPSRNYQIRHLLDEVFGAEGFKNEIVWWYWNKMQGNINYFASNHDTIYYYAKGTPVFNKVKTQREESKRQLKRAWDSARGMLVNAKDENGNLIYIESEEKTLDDVWQIPMLQPADKTENLRFPTQKREEILSAIITASSSPGDLVLDSFIGSGTTAAVAQKLGRQWIGCDINKGAIQTTAKRLQVVMQEQAKVVSAPAQKDLADSENASPKPCQFSFTAWRVNDYDLQIQHNEAVELVAEYLGVTRTRTDNYFDGTLGNKLVKIVPFNHPLTPLDIEDLKAELKRRPEEERDITLVSLGMELAAKKVIEDHNRNRPINKLEHIELRTDKRYGGIIKHEPLSASVEIKRDGDKLHVEIHDVFSPTILQRLDMQEGVFRAKIEDWRSVVDCVMIDTDYNGEVFNVALPDIPARKQDLVQGRYEIPAPKKGATVAVKIIDMLGEETLVTKAI